MSDQQPGADRFTYEGGPASDPPPGRVSDEQVEIDLEQMLASVSCCK